MRRLTTAAVAAAALVLGGLGVLPAQAATATLGSVTVTVTAPGGAPIADAYVTLSGPDYDGGSTDASGTFRSDDLDPGAYNLEVQIWSPSGYNPASRSVTIVAGQDGAETVTVDGLQVLSGKVTRGGAPVDKGFVSVDGGAGKSYYAQLTNGTYSTLVASGTTYKVLVYPDYTSVPTFLPTYANGTVREVDAARVAVRADAAATANIATYSKLGRITGVVRDSKGKPVAGADIWVSASNRTGYGSARSAANGTYTVEGLPAGRYEVHATKGTTTSYSAAKGASYSVKAGATTKTAVTVRSLPKGAITLKVKASSSVWKRTAGVCATAMTSKGLWAGGSCADKKTKKLTIKGLAAGTYKVTLDGTNQTSKVVVKKNRTTTKSVTRPTGTSVSGTVRSASNKVLAKANVQIYDGNGTMLGAATTNSKGRYTIPGAVKGTYRVDVRPAKASSGAFAGKKFTVKSGKKAAANARLVKSATVSGKVTSTSGKAIAGMNVTVFGPSGFGYATTNAKGEYKVSGLLKGTYQVTSTDPYVGGYYNTKSAKVKVSTGKTSKAATLKAVAG